MRLRNLALILFSATSVSAQTVTIRAGHLLDGKGGSSANTTVSVAGGKITGVATSKAAKATYDLSRYTVLPGLIDAHDHVGWYFNKKDRFHSGQDGETVIDESLAAAGNANTTLLAGWTTIASPGALVPSPHSDSATHTSTVRMPGPRNEPS